eukprot:CAMPEP_0183712738 /NCGR_PEP_ID=MMETSP0737-20130205/7804_1 /TAXON_ID=385413 /ORGANISM="Thalassiosira miniscula, Strain CCMP1093" /LENGTH=212 /DNA_ID=CAMNT_0025941415 /DNA_START=20 /DNA_END=658 /DNA_ORIENTATION=+
MTAVMSTWMALLLLVAYAAAATAASTGSFGGFQRISTAASTPSHPRRTSLHQFRGGAIADSDDEYDSEYDSDEEDEPIVVKAKKLASSTKSVAQKKKAAAVKSKVKVAMAASSASATKTVAKKAGGGSLYKRYVPYIIRACLNPFTLIAMTKAYFVSLCDINYLKEEQSQTLRSALEEKARKQQPSSGPTKPKRKMRPGQAKTISDLPQLSA